MSSLRRCIVVSRRVNERTVQRVIKRQFAAGSPRSVHVFEERSKRDASQFSCEIVSGVHVSVSDLAKEAGGNNLGMSPKELLMASLGSCTAMTIRTVYNNSKELSEKRQTLPSSTPGGWANSTLDDIFVKVQEWGDHPHIPAKLSIDIELKGKLSTEQRTALLSASQRCPVKTMLTKGILIETILVDS